MSEHGPGATSIDVKTIVLSYLEALGDPES
jgi:hypothetical protein